MRVGILTSCPGSQQHEPLCMQGREEGCKLTSFKARAAFCLGQVKDSKHLDALAQPIRFFSILNFTDPPNEGERFLP